MMKKLCVLVCIWITAVAIVSGQEKVLTQGMTISTSCQIKKATYPLFIASKASFLDSINRWDSAQPVITITGENLVIDFQHAELQGAVNQTLPDQFRGVAIKVRGKNITIKNLRVKSYKIAVWAFDSDSIRLENCDFSYNYRPRLHSTREREDFSDWLSYHQNEHNEWLRYGTGIYLENCRKAVIKACKIMGNQNALLMNRCTDALIYNNTFQFNSGLGIGMYRSSRNRIMHNRLDWNVRGYSHGIYQRGQDSAAILVYEQSNENIFAYNSCTHSGDGFFLWAGQSTMDSGEGGSNDNLLFGNDFSHAPTNGVEVTFSRNTIRGNLIRECTHGIWGGYSYETLIMGNYISDCKTGVAIEHGQKNTIQQNLFEDDSTGINFWARAEQPTDWGYAQKRDTRSRDGLIDRNVFLSTRKPLKMSGSQNMVVNGVNLFFDFDKIIEMPKPNEGFRFLRNEIYGTAAEIAAVWQQPELKGSEKINFSYPKNPENPYSPLEIPVVELQEPDSLKDGIVAALPQGFPRGRSWIMMEDWGPYDFRRPIAHRKEILQDKGDALPLYIYTLFMPPGKWRILNAQGIGFISDTSGTYPIELSVSPQKPMPDQFNIEFEFIGAGITYSPLGVAIPAGEPQRFSLQEFFPDLKWDVAFFNYAPTQKIPSKSVFEGSPIAQKQTKDLYFAWWDKPAEGVDPDHFATLATASFEISAGDYLLELSSDDGVILYLDGKKLIDHWNIHEPETDQVTVRLGGKHQIRIEHFEGGGFSTLDFRIRPAK